jgi:hypothetical protein
MNSVGVGVGGSAAIGVAVRSEIGGVVGCARSWGGENVCAGAVCRAEVEGAEVVDGTTLAGAWFWDDADDWTCCVGDTMATFHLNASF